MEPQHLVWEKLVEGRFEDGDCGNPTTKPKWFDADKYHRGQQLIRDNLLCVMFCHLAGLVLGVVIDLPYTVLSNMGNHGCLKDIGTRYLGTSKKLLSWYSTDIFNLDSEGAKSLAMVRRMHGAAHRTMNRSYPRAEDDRELWMSQFYMATTQISFVGFMVLYPQAVGLGHLSQKDQEAILHYWRCIGYLLGISDTYNVCGGSVEVVRTLTKDFVDNLLRPAMLATTAERFNLATDILESILTATRNMTVTVHGFISYWCNLLNVEYQGKLSWRDRICRWLLGVLYTGPLLAYWLPRMVLNALHLRRYRVAHARGLTYIPTTPVHRIDVDLAGCPYMAQGSLAVAPGVFYG